MKKKVVLIDKLEVSSFVTNLTEKANLNLKGGTSHEDCPICTGTEISGLC